MTPLLNSRDRLILQAALAILDEAVDSTPSRLYDADPSKLEAHRLGQMAGSFTAARSQLQSALILHDVMTEDRETEATAPAAVEA